MTRLEVSGRAGWRRSIPVVALAFGLAASSCAKKEPKPKHSEPWLAHPPASAALSPDASLTTTRYVLTAPSLIRFELATKRGKVQGRLTKVSGELTVALGALAQSRGQVRAELGSIALDSDDANGSAWLARLQAALGESDAGAPSASIATFDLTGFDDVSPEAIEPATASDGGTTALRRVRGTATGNLLLNGFRVQKRQPLEAEFGFSNDRTTPAKLTIRSRAPLLVSLETHEIHLREPADSATERRAKRPQSAPHDVRVSLELYAIKD